MTLTDFLLARIAEDEQVADEFWEGDYVSGQPEPGTWWKWVRDECDAKRRIVGIEQARIDQSVTAPELRTRFLNPDGSPIMYALAAVYAGHPDYREEWKP